MLTTVYLIKNLAIYSINMRYTITFLLLIICICANAQVTSIAEYEQKIEDSITNKSVSRSITKQNIAEGYTDLSGLIDSLYASKPYADSVAAAIGATDTPSLQVVTGKGADTRNIITGTGIILDSVALAAGGGDGGSAVSATMISLNDPNNYIGFGAMSRGYNVNMHTFSDYRYLWFGSGASYAEYQARATLYADNISPLSMGHFIGFQAINKAVDFTGNGNITHIHGHTSEVQTSGVRTDLITDYDAEKGYIDTNASNPVHAGYFAYDFTTETMKANANYFLLQPAQTGGMNMRSLIGSRTRFSLSNWDTASWTRYLVEIKGTAYVSDTFFANGNIVASNMPTATSAQMVYRNATTGLLTYGAVPSATVDTANYIATKYGVDTAKSNLRTTIGGKVPYTGATTSVNLGLHSLTATNVTLGSSGTLTFSDTRYSGQRNSGTGEYEITGTQTGFVGYRFKRNTTTLFHINNDGDITATGKVTTAQPSATGAGAWKLGKKVTAAVTLVTTDYIEVEIDGVIYKLALVN